MYMISDLFVNHVTPTCGPTPSFVILFGGTWAVCGEVLVVVELASAKHAVAVALPQVTQRPRQSEDGVVCLAVVIVVVIIFCTVDVAAPDVLPTTRLPAFLQRRQRPEFRRPQSVLRHLVP